MRKISVAAAWQLLVYGAVVGIFFGCFTRLMSSMQPPSRPLRFKGSSIDIATRV